MAAQSLEPDQIRELVDRVCLELNRPVETRRRDWYIFQQALGGNSPDALQALGEFLKDVRTCPPAVIAWCQAFLAPYAIAAE